MQIFLLAFFFSQGFFAFEETPDIQELLKKAGRKDKAAFATDYLHAAFSFWQDRFGLESFRVDSVFAKGEYDEVWLNKAGPELNSNHRLALLVSRNPIRKIGEARRLLITERARLQPIENELVEFIERFAWIYETGAESFMHDFLFPSHIKLRYEGLTDQNEILTRLRIKFKDILPVQSLGWEGHNYTYVIRLVVDSPLKPLEISVDIQKHLTTNFFEMADKSDRVEALKDSLQIWSAPKRASDAGRDLIVAGRTPYEAIAKVLAKNFKAYDLVVLDSTAKSATIEATLPAIEQLRPASLRYRLDASRAGANKYSILPIWLTSQLNRDGVAAAPNAKKNPASSSDADRVLNELAGETIQRYGTLDLPPAFQPEFGGTRSASGNLVLHHRQTDSVQWHSPAAFQNILRGLTRDKSVYFFFEGSMKNANNLLVTGYAIWRDQQRLWQHVAKIQETYSFANSKYQLRNVKIDLYPYIRLENVHTLFAPPDTSARRREKIVIQR